MNNIMTYQHCIEEINDFLRVEVSGTRTLGNSYDDALGVWSDIAQRAAALGLTKVLYLSHVSGSLSVMEAYDIVDELVAKRWNSLKIAYVDFAGVENDDLMMIKAICLKHRVILDVFPTEDGAIAWLEQLD